MRFHPGKNYHARMSADKMDPAAQAELADLVRQMIDETGIPVVRSAGEARAIIGLVVPARGGKTEATIAAVRSIPATCAHPLIMRREIDGRYHLCSCGALARVDGEEMRAGPPTRAAEKKTIWLERK